MRTDLAFFSTLIKCGSLTAAAREFDVTPSAVSKWLAQLESRLGVRLIARNTRRISLTNEGEVYLSEGRRILAEIDDLERTISSSRAEPVGLLKVNATLGFGRSFIAPAVSRFSAQYPDLEIQLLLTSRPLSLAEGAADVGIRFGEPPDARVTARKIADHRRRIFASPAYLEERGRPQVPHDLTHHNCLIVRQDEVAYGQWHFIEGTAGSDHKGPWNPQQQRRRGGPGLGAEGPGNPRCDPSGTQRRSFGTGSSKCCWMNMHCPRPISMPCTRRSRTLPRRCGCSSNS